MALLDTGAECVEVGHVAELLHDFAVVADVVPVVCIWRVKMRTEPDNVNPKLLQVIELRGDAGQVADAVAIRVFEGARIDLVDNSFLPPLGFVTVDEGGFLAPSGGKREQGSDDGCAEWGAEEHDEKCTGRD